MELWVVDTSAGANVVSCGPAGESVPTAPVDSWADSVVDDNSTAESVEDSVVDSLTDCGPEDEDSAGIEDGVVGSSGC